MTNPASSDINSPALPAHPRPSRLGVLRHKHFAIVWAAAAISSIGTWMESVGVHWIVAEKTGSTVMMGYVAIAQLGPTLLLGILGGLAADRFNRRTLLIVTQAVMMLVAAALTVAAYTDHASPTMLIWLMLLHGIAQAFNVPAWQVLTPRLVPREELGRAIALNSLQFNIARILGPAVAGVVLAAAGPTPLFALNTLSFLVVIVAVAWTPSAPVAYDRAASAWRQTKEAFSFVFHKVGPRRVFLSLVLASVLAGPVLRMLPLFVSEVYLASESAYGLLLSLMGVGAVAGALALKWIPDWYPRHHLIPLSLAGLGVSIALFTLSPSLAFSTPCIVAVGWFWVWAFNVSVTAMQLLVDDSMRGRVMSVTNTAVFGAMPLGSLAASAIGETSAARLASDLAARSALAVQIGVGALAVLLAIAGLWTLTHRVPEIDALQEGEPGFDRRPGLRRGLSAREHKPQRPTASAGSHR